jgi:GNAT superfamily N-acetyltransferase
MRKKDIAIRRIQRHDLSAAMRLSTQQDWNQTETDWSLIIENPQNICLLAEYHGQIIGTTAAMNYSDEIAWINMVLVDKEFRGQGIGKSLLENIFNKLQHFGSIKLDATPEGHKVYMAFNFKEEYSIFRMTLDFAKPQPLEGDLLPGPIQSNHIPEIIAFDKHIFGAARHHLIESLIKQYPHKAWMLKRKDKITGFVLGRDGRNHQHIGPLMAQTSSDAKILFAKSISGLEGKPVVVDVLSDKVDLVNWLTNMGFIRQRYFTRMYRNHNPFPGHANNQYMICGPEFG